jgi:hypothetical protein
VPLGASLYGPIKKQTQRTSNAGDTYQDTAATHIGRTSDLWDAQEAFIIQPRADGQGLKKTRLRLNLQPSQIETPDNPGLKPPRIKTPGKRGRRKVFTLGEGRQRTRQNNKKAQRKLSGRYYRVEFQAAYQKGKQKLERKGQVTPQRLRALKEYIIAVETTPHTGVVKRKELDEFDRWVEDDLELIEDSSKPPALKKIPADFFS